MSKLFFSLLFLVLVISSCKDKEVEENLLMGHWTLTEGFRKNKPSKMLDGIYFNLESPAKVTTNFMGAEARGTFALEQKNLTIDTGGQKTKFKVKELTENTLTLETTIQGIPFRFVLERK